MCVFVLSINQSYFYIKTLTVIIQALTKTFMHIYAFSNSTFSIFPAAAPAAATATGATSGGGGNTNTAATATPQPQTQAITNAGQCFTFLTITFIVCAARGQQGVNIVHIYVLFNHI